MQGGRMSWGTDTLLPAGTSEPAESTVENNSYQLQQTLRKFSFYTVTSHNLLRYLLNRRSVNHLHI